MLLFFFLFFMVQTYICLFCEGSQYLKFILAASKIAHHFQTQKAATSSTNLVRHFTEIKEGEESQSPNTVLINR